MPENRLHHPIRDMMGEDLFKFRAEIDAEVYPAYRRRVSQIEAHIPTLNNHERVALVQLSVISLLQERVNPTGNGISPQNNAVLRYLINGLPLPLRQSYVNGSGFILVKNVNTKVKALEVYRSSAFYANHQAYITYA